MLRLLVLFASSFSALSLGSLSASFAASPEQSTPGKPVAVLELFTSQSCSSCPPAEDLLAEYADQPDLIALEWHVDYWNDLVLPQRGRWRDPFSDSQFTERQRTYNEAIRHRRLVYTPQMVINGQAEAIGSDRRQIDSLVARHTLSTSPVIEVAEQDNLATVTFPSSANDEANLHALVVYVKPVAETSVGGGENKGLMLREHNIVRGFTDLGPIAGDLQKTFSMPPAGQQCVVLIQNAPVGAIVGAATCPTAEG